MDEKFALENSTPDVMICCNHCNWEITRYCDEHLNWFINFIKNFCVTLSLPSPGLNAYKHMYIHTHVHTHTI